MTTLHISGQPVGPGHPCYVIAEAGSNHDGQQAKALELIDIAADAGADAVKFQLFRADRLYPRSAGVSAYLEDPTPIYRIIANMELPYEWLPALVDRCQERGIHFLASAFDEESVDRLDPYVPAFKIASYEMTHLPLVAHVAAKQKPVIVSTGTANVDEIEEMVKAFHDTGNRQLALMQCTASYPAPLEAINVRAIPALRDRFDVPVGLSDHSRDPLVAPLAAVACGASLIEKHFTISNSLPGPDHRFAVEPPELRVMVQKIRDTEVVLGSGVKQVEPVETELRRFARRTIFTRGAVRAGDPLTLDNLIVLRCGQHEAGFAPAQLSLVLGRRAARDIPDASVLTPADLE